MSTHEENVPTIEELGARAGQGRGILDDIAEHGVPGGSRRITVEISEREFIRLGGERGLQRLSDDVSDFVNDYISTLHS